MAIQQWTILDCDKGIYLENLDVSVKLAGVDCRVTKKRLYGGLQDGVDVIEIDNGEMRLLVCPTRGMGVLRAERGAWTLKWDSSARGPVHPKFVPLSDPSGLGWLEGFSEWIVRCGLESNGSPEFAENGTLRYSLHGRIANTPAHKVALFIDDETGEIKLVGYVEETRMFFKKMELKVEYTLLAGTPGFSLKDTVTNLSASSGEFEYLYHINTGMPLASPGARMLVPYDRLAPRSPAAAKELDTWNRCDPEMPGSEEVVYFIVPKADETNHAHAMLIAKEGDAALNLRFSREQFPYFCLWKSRLHNGDGYVVGLEPCINFPNTRSFEKAHDRVATLEAGQSRSFELFFEIHTDPAAVAETLARLESLQKAAKGEVLDNPDPQWSE